jgi:DNA-binding Xre family transcriptional regulator
MILSKFQDLRRRKAFEEKRDLPLRTIAAESGLSLATVQRISSGNVERVSLPTLNVLCRYFGVQSISELIEYVPEEGRG